MSSNSSNSQVKTEAHFGIFHSEIMLKTEIIKNEDIVDSDIVDNEQIESVNLKTETSDCIIVVDTKEKEDSEQIESLNFKTETSDCLIDFENKDSEKEDSEQFESVNLETETSDCLMDFDNKDSVDSEIEDTNQFESVTIKTDNPIDFKHEDSETLDTTDPFETVNLKPSDSTIDFDHQDVCVQVDSTKNYKPLERIKVKKLHKTRRQLPKPIICNEKLKCHVCYETYFLTTQHLNHHLIYTHDYKSCHKCFTIFKSTYECSKHKCKNYLLYPKITFKCSYCDYETKFISRVNFLRHLISQHEHLVCKACNAVFVTQKSFQKHKKRFHDIKSKNYITKTGKIIQCPHCFRQKFDDALSLRQHLHLKHDHLMCTYGKCTQVFLTQQQFAMHKAAKHIKKGHNHKQFQCSICSLIYPDKKTHDNHKTKHFQCKLCLEYFKTNFELAQHYGTEHRQLIKNQKFLMYSQIVKFKRQNGLEISFYCSKCSLYFSARLKYLKHIRDHLKEKCNKCDFIAINNSQLKRHLKSNHPQYICDFCDEYFSEICSKKEFERHVKKHVDNQCKECSFTALTVTSLKNHFEYNHQIFNCVKCSFTCFGYKNLVSHNNKFKHNLRCLRHCKLRTNNVVRFKKHFIRYHKNAFLCEICYHHTKSVLTMMAHKLTHSV